MICALFLLIKVTELNLSVMFVLLVPFENVLNKIT